MGVGGQKGRGGSGPNEPCPIFGRFGKQSKMELLQVVPPKYNQRRDSKGL